MERKITFNWNRNRRAREGNVENISIHFSTTVNSVRTSHCRAKRKSHHLTMWYLSYVSQLWLRICCWFSFFVRLFQCALAESPLCLHIVWKIHISRSSTHLSFFFQSSHSSVIPPAFTYISISLLASSNKNLLSESFTEAFFLLCS